MGVGKLLDIKRLTRFSFLDVRECFRMFQNVSKMFQNILECSRVLKNVTERLTSFRRFGTVVE